LIFKPASLPSLSPSLPPPYLRVRHHGTGLRVRVEHLTELGVAGGHLGREEGREGRREGGRKGGRKGGRDE